MAWEFFAPHELSAIQTEFGCSEPLARHLVNRYGRQAQTLATIIRERGEDQPVIAGEPDVIGEWAYRRTEEMALTRSDLLLRRSRIGMWHEELLTDT